MATVTEEDLAIQPAPPSECAPFVYVITAYKNGGAMGYDEWELVGVYVNEHLAVAARDAYVKAR